jgi:hypothetical protein
MDTMDDTKPKQKPRGRAVVNPILSPEWRDKAFNLARQGYGQKEILRELCTSANMWYNSMRDPEIQRYLHSLRDLAEAWWLAEGRNNMNNKNYNWQLYNAQMRIRFGYNLTAAAASVTVDGETPSDTPSIAISINVRSPQTTTDNADKA